MWKNYFVVRVVEIAIQNILAIEMVSLIVEDVFRFKDAKWIEKSIQLERSLHELITA